MQSQGRNHIETMGIVEENMHVKPWLIPDHFVDALVLIVQHLEQLPHLAYKLNLDYYC